ncbi:MAG: tyrosine-type recombinase/integrase [Monoglobales bacterium]
MASIVQRNNRYNVVYLYDDEATGKRKQKWESFKTMADVKRRKAEIEYRQEIGTMVIHQCKTVDELLKEYVALYGKTTWSMSVYGSNTALIEHYISPIIGSMKLSDVTARVLEKYYMQLLKTPSVHRITQKANSKNVIYVAPPTVRKIHNILRSAFHQAVKWDLMEKNPAMYATVPKSEAKKREIWDAPTLFHALEVCEDERLKLAINLAFACSLRIGELLGLTWDCIDISPESIAAGKAYVYVNKELQRVDKSVMKVLGKKDVLRVFPELRESNKTVLVLKKPKTATSTRKIFLPKTVAEMLVNWKREQDFTKEALGNEYADFDLVMANGLGMPTEQSRITALFAELIEKNDLPKVVFHSLRHSSITYKLKLNGGDIKSVQGDSGHAQAQMVTDQYSHILDDDRKNNAALFEKAFYSGKGADSIEPQAETGSEAKAAPSGVDPDLLAKILSNPEMAALLTTLVKSLN